MELGTCGLGVPTSIFMIMSFLALLQMSPSLIFFFPALPNTSRYGPVGRHRWAGHGSVGPRRRREIWTTAIFSKQNKATEQPNHEPSSKYLIELRINYTREPRNSLRKFACTRQQLPAGRLYTNDRMHRMRRKVARCVMLNHKNSKEWIGELLISIF